MAGAEIALLAVGWPTVDPQARFAHKEIYWKTDPNLRAEPTRLGLDRVVFGPVRGGNDEGKAGNVKPGNAVFEHRLGADRQKSLAGQPA